VAYVVGWMSGMSPGFSLAYWRVSAQYRFVERVLRSVRDAGIVEPIHQQRRPAPARKPVAPAMIKAGRVPRRRPAKPSRTVTLSALCLCPRQGLHRAQQ
jgi:hypothetical protein